MNQENYQNSEKIAQILSEKYQNKDLSKVKVLDICCGVFDQKGSGYDVKGEIYQPLVAQKLGQLGFDVTGVDFREGEILRSAQDDRNNAQDDVLNYTHRFDINILEENWQEKLEKDWDVLIFLRSWDTPEILLHYQKVLDIDDLNLLCLEIAKIYLPIFADLLELKGLFFTTDICNFAVCEDEFEIQLYKNQVNQLFKKNGFELLEQENGLHLYQKTNI